jgi:hypothetical protein
MLGVAGILAGGYAATASRPEEPAPAAPVQATPESESADAWAQRATIALASVNRQLDTLAQAEEEWRRLPESRRSGVVPAPVTRLEEHRAVLEKRRATLQSQLQAYRSLRETQHDLAVSEQHLRAVENALTGAPDGPRRTTEQTAAVAALDEQRDLRIRQRDAQRAALESLREGVSTAVRTPLPDDVPTTTQVSRDVLEVIRNGGREPARPSDDPQPPRPDVVGGREEEDGQPRQEVGTSGPPDPRGPRDESEERRAEADRRADAAGRATQDAARSALAQIRAQEARKEEERREAERAAAATQGPEAQQEREAPKAPEMPAEPPQADGGADRDGEPRADADRSEADARPDAARSAVAQSRAAREAAEGKAAEREAAARAREADGSATGRDTPDRSTQPEGERSTDVARGNAAATSARRAPSGDAVPITAYIIRGKRATADGPDRDATERPRAERNTDQKPTAQRSADRAATAENDSENAEERATAKEAAERDAENRDKPRPTPRPTTDETATRQAPRSTKARAREADDDEIEEENATRATLRPADGFRSADDAGDDAVESRELATASVGS